MSNNRLVGLCIVYKNHNYGSILQSYATLLKMEELGIDYEIINYSHPKNLKFYISAIGRLASKDTLYSKMRSFKRMMGCKIHPQYAKNDSKRTAKFDLFINLNFKHFTKPIHDFDKLKEYSHRYTDVLVGSDQMWLPSGLGTNFYNLMFVPDKTNKIAYAASFGVAKIPSHQKKKTKRYLDRINYISLREESGQRIVKELTGKNVPVILDPTMIVSKSTWDQKIKDEIIENGDYIFCYFLGNNPSHREEVRSLAKAKNMKIVVLRHLDEYIPEDEKFGDVARYDIGPAEFVNLIRHAKYICTDSFHGSVFSIIYHKQFVSFNRYSDGSNSRNSRLDTLFSNVGISRRFNGCLINQIDESIDWNSVDANIQTLRDASNQYIDKAFSLDETVSLKQTYEGSIHLICDKETCTGCSACSSICPKEAITMELDEKGFWRPVINVELCVECNRCNIICPVNQPPQLFGPTSAYAYQNTDEVRFNSTSGGFFNAIACSVIENGGVVCGAAFDSNMMLHHMFVDKTEELGPLQRSKYVQSDLSGIFRRIRDYLSEKRMVLFVGTGCQAAGLRKYIGDDQNLIIVDVVCYGVPSSGLFQDWIHYLETKHGKVTDIRFRDKSYGYATPNVKVTFDNKKTIESCRDSNIYTDLFFRHLSIQYSCYSCRFKTTNRASDLTLGDLWSIGRYIPEKDDNKGTTVVFAHTERGKELCKRICQKELETMRIVSTDARKMIECVSPARGVNGFWQKYHEDGFLSMISLYVRNDYKSKIKYAIKRIMNRLGISKMWYKSKKKTL